MEISEVACGDVVRLDAPAGPHEQLLTAAEPGLADRGFRKGLFT